MMYIHYNDEAESFNEYYEKRRKLPIKTPYKSFNYMRVMYIYVFILLMICVQVNMKDRKVIKYLSLH